MDNIEKSKSYSSGSNQDVIIVDDSSSDSRCSLLEADKSININEKRSQSAVCETNVLTSQTKIPKEPFSLSEHEESRKVEPLKINLTREAKNPLIKFPTNQEQQQSPKIKIKPIKPPGEELNNSCKDSQADQSTFYVPKLHIKNLNEGCPSVEIMKNRKEELSIPKLVIKNIEQKASLCKEFTSNRAEINESNAIPKITIKIDSQSSAINLIETREHLSQKSSKKNTENSSSNTEGKKFNNIMNYVSLYDT